MPGPHITTPRCAPVIWIVGGCMRWNKNRFDGQKQCRTDRITRTDTRQRCINLHSQVTRHCWFWRSGCGTNGIICHTYPIDSPLTDTKYDIFSDSSLKWAQSVPDNQIGIVVTISWVCGEQMFPCLYIYLTAVSVVSSTVLVYDRGEQGSTYGLWALFGILQH